MSPANKSFVKYPKQLMFTELGSSRQVKRMRKSLEHQNWQTLSETDKKHLERSQFAFGNLYPYTFDGLTYIATHNREIIKDIDKYYYVIEMPFTDFIHYCLLEWTGSRQYLKNELQRKCKMAENQDEYKFLRYIPLVKGDYISIAPITIGFHYRPLTEMTKQEIQRLKQIDRFNPDTKAIKNIVIYVLKPLLSPILEKNKNGGYASFPSALQAKIDYILEHCQNELKRFRNLTPIFLRKYFLFLNSRDHSKKSKQYLIIDAVDFWMHVSPSELSAGYNGKCLNIRNPKEKIQKLADANNFFAIMAEEGLMKGAKAFPTTSEIIKQCQPVGIHYDKKSGKYKIRIERSFESYY
jgi:hypothetical protein